MVASRLLGGEMTVNLTTATTQSNASILEGAFCNFPSYLQEVIDCLCPGCMLEQLLQLLHILAEMLTSATTTQIYPLHENEEPYKLVNNIRVHIKMFYKAK